MRYLKVENIILVILLFLLFDSFNPFSSRGINEAEELYRMKIHDLNQEKVILLKENNQLETKINDFKNERSKIDSITNGYSNVQIDSFYTKYFER